MSKREQKDASVCKPSGYDVVIRNSNAIKDLNGKLGALLDKKERLMEEMWAACPHESVVRSDEVLSTLFGPTPVPSCFCTSCGLYEQSREGRFKALKPKRGRTVVTVPRAEFSAKFGETTKRTGINK